MLTAVSACCPWWQQRMHLALVWSMHPHAALRGRVSAGSQLRLDPLPRSAATSSIMPVAGLLALPL